MRKDEMALIMAYSTFNNVKHMYNYDNLLKMKKDELKQAYEEFLKLEMQAIKNNEI